MIALICGSLSVFDALDLRCGPQTEHDIVSVEKRVIFRIFIADVLRIVWTHNQTSTVSSLFNRLLFNELREGYLFRLR